MTSTVRVGACQTPEVREDVDTALSIIECYAEQARLEGVDLLCFPECFLQGYLVDEEQARHHTLDLDSAAFAEILQRLASTSPTLVFGMIERSDEKLFNTAVMIERGRLIGRYRKSHLLDGERVFTPGTAYPIFDVAGLKFGINICYDMQFPEAAMAVAAQGARLMLGPSNNMMRRSRADEWRHLHTPMRAERAKEAGVWLVSADVVGENEGRISYGTSTIINPQGEVVAQLPPLQTGMIVAEIGLS